MPKILKFSKNSNVGQTFSILTSFRAQSHSVSSSPSRQSRLSSQTASFGMHAPLEHAYSSTVQFTCGIGGNVAVVINVRG